MIDMSGKIRIRVRLGDYYKTVSEVVRSLGIATVCEDALGVHGPHQLNRVGQAAGERGR